MLRLLENCDTTSVILALIELIIEYQAKNDKNLTSLAIKCLLKTTHNLSNQIDNIKVDKILLQIHILMLSLQKNNPDLAEKTQINTMIVKSVKNIVGDLVTIKKEKILDDYSKSIKNHILKDKFIFGWIKSSLESLK